MPDDPERFLASMGIYVFNADFLYELLCQDAADPHSSHDFGKNLLPAIIERHKVQAYPFRDRRTGETLYWRDVGTIEAFYEANMDLVAVQPELNLYDQSWPIHSYNPPWPPAKTVFDHEQGRNGVSGKSWEALSATAALFRADACSIRCCRTTCASTAGPRWTIR